MMHAPKRSRSVDQHERYRSVFAYGVYTVWTEQESDTQVTPAPSRPNTTMESSLPSFRPGQRWEPRQDQIGCQKIHIQFGENLQKD